MAEGGTRQGLCMMGHRNAVNIAVPSLLQPSLQPAFHKRPPRDGRAGWQEAPGTQRRPGLRSRPCLLRKQGALLLRPVSQANRKRSSKVRLPIRLTATKFTTLLHSPLLFPLEAPWEESSANCFPYELSFLQAPHVSRANTPMVLSHDSTVTFLLAALRSSLLKSKAIKPLLPKNQVCGQQTP